MTPYSPSGLTLWSSWNRFIGVFSTDAHQIAPVLYTRTSMLPYLSTVAATSCLIFSKSLVSTGIAVASPPASRISRSTVLMVDCDEFGSGGKGFAFEASETVFAATTTAPTHSARSESQLKGHDTPLYPFLARSIATWRPIPRDAPTTNATG
jgi:hypothetical protein